MKSTNDSSDKAPPHPLSEYGKKIASALVPPILLFFIGSFLTLLLTSTFLNPDEQQRQYFAPCNEDQVDGYSLNINNDKDSQFLSGADEDSVVCKNKDAAIVNDKIDTHDPLDHILFRFGFRHFLGLNLSYEHILSIFGISATIAVAYSMQYSSRGREFSNMASTAPFQKGSGEYQKYKNETFPDGTLDISSLKKGEPSAEDEWKESATRLKTSYTWSFGVGLIVSVGLFSLTVIYTASEIANRPFITGNFKPWTSTGAKAYGELASELIHPRYFILILLSIAILTLFTLESFPKIRQISNIITKLETEKKSAWNTRNRHRAAKYPRVKLVRDSLISKPLSSSFWQTPLSAIIILIQAFTVAVITGNIISWPYSSERGIDQFASITMLVSLFCYIGGACGAILATRLKWGFVGSDDVLLFFVALFSGILYCGMLITLWLNLSIRDYLPLFLTYAITGLASFLVPIFCHHIGIRLLFGKLEIRNNFLLSVFAPTAREAYLSISKRLTEWAETE